MWPAALLEDLLDIPSVEVIPLPLSTIFTASQSVPNPIAYLPQLGTTLTPDMVMKHLSTESSAACTEVLVALLLTSNWQARDLP